MQRSTTNLDAQEYERLFRAGLADGQRWAEPPAAGSSADPTVQTHEGWGGHPARPVHLDSLPGYENLRELHRGGQGVVYQALQRSTKRRVAIKVLRRSENESERKRFARESFLLSELRHPNIVAVYDAGEIADCHFIVMDFVDGVPIDEYVRESLVRDSDLAPPAAASLVRDSDLAPPSAGIPSRERPASERIPAGAGGRRSKTRSPKSKVETVLRLFAKVCDAVNTAHLKGVIHRDLKPANILVVASGEPRVLDFGLAKLERRSPLPVPSLQPDATAPVDSDGSSPAGNWKLETGDCTETGQFVGTVAWASPEQAAGRNTDIDTRTDVYALGVVLYQLLTGSFPYEVRGPMRDTLNNIVTAEPARPRAVVRSASSLDPSIPRSLDPFFVDDEVETIILKCLAKDPARRYQSAGDLASDMRHYLAGRPIDARRDSAWYMLRKTLQRHRGAVAITAAFLLLLSAGSVVSTVLWQNAERARDAESDQRARAEVINTFLEDMLTAADPAKTKGVKLTVRETLDKAAKQIDDSPLGAQPLVEAHVRATIGSTYFALGLHSEAQAQLRAAEAIQARELGDDHLDVLRTRGRLVQSYALHGDHGPAVTLGRPTLERQRRVLGDEHQETLRTLSSLGSALIVSGEFEESESCLRRALAGQVRTLGREHVDSIDSMLWLAYVLDWTSEEGLSLAQEALELATRTRGPEDPYTIWAVYQVGVSFVAGRNHAEAEVWMRRALELARRVLGDEHHRTVDIMADLGGLLPATGKPQEAEQFERQAVEIARRSYGLGKKWTTRYQTTLGQILKNQKRYADAAEVLADAVEQARRAIGDEDLETLHTRNAYAGTLLKLERNTEAAAQAAEAFETARRTVGASNWFTVNFGRRYAETLWKLNQIAAAESILQQNVSACREAFGSHNPRTLAELDRCAWFFCDCGRLAQAEPLAREAAEGYRRIEPKFRRRVGNPVMTLATIVSRLGRAEEALELRLEAARSPDTNAKQLNQAAWELLTWENEKLRDPALALELALKANELGHYDNPQHLDTLALAYYRTGKTAKAIEIQTKALSLLAADAPDRTEYEDRLREFQAASESAVDTREK